ncbi:MAG: hypothetical protein Q9195_007740 [Heterodermia aff. obscurata]
MNSSPYNVGVIGYGMSAKVFHIPLIGHIPELKLYAVVQRNPKPDDDAEKDHPGIKSYRSTEEMVKDGDVHVVVVTTVPDTHFELTKLALERGKHGKSSLPAVLKRENVDLYSRLGVKQSTPISLDTAGNEADELIALAKKKQRLLTVYQNRRWDTDFLTLLALLKDNALGRITEFETHFDRHRPTLPSGGSWKTKAVSGGGAIYDLGTHLIDQVIVAFGLPKRVTGFVGSQRGDNPAGYEDSCTVLLHYEKMTATVKAAVVSLEEKQLRFWVRGVEGTYKKYGLDIQEEQLKAGMKPGEQGFGIESSDQDGTLTTLQNGNPTAHPCPNIIPVTYSAFYAQFARALAGTGGVPVKPEDASAVIKLIELARRSSQEGRTLDVEC